MQRRRVSGFARALEEVHEAASERILRVSFWATDALGAYVERINVKPAMLDVIGPYGRDRRLQPRR